MRYISFTIEHYRGITDAIEVDVERHPFLPIVGLNESGKSSILEAIFCLDVANDAEFGGRHLRDTKNAWTLGKPASPIVSAVVMMSLPEMEDVFREIPSAVKNIGDLHIVPGVTEMRVQISRNLEANKYTLGLDVAGSHEAQDRAARSALKRLPPIHYFPNEREIIGDSIRIAEGPPDGTEVWLPVFDRIFAQAGVGYAVADLPNLPDRRRAAVLHQVNNHLNEALREHAGAIRFWDVGSTELELGYFEQLIGSNTQRRLRIDVSETDPDRRKHYFGVTQRSDGFRWFLGFILRTRFHPRQALGDAEGAVYLFDEPVSFLHPAAQRRWNGKLRRIAERNSVIFSTHSQHLLEPSVVPVKSVHFAERSKRGSVSLRPFHDYKVGRRDQRFALQPLFDALEVQPFTLSFARGPVIITEGIYDYYSLMMFRGGRDVVVLPGTDASSVKHHASYMIAWDIDFRALWDHDDEGLEQKRRATESFGEVIANKHFFALPADPANRHWKMDNLWDQQDLDEIKARLGLNPNAKYEKTTLLLFHDPHKDEILTALAGSTRQNFEELFSHLGL